MTQMTDKPARKWPLHGWIGLVLVILFWILNWSLSGLRSHWGFFPLWLGYSLTADALVFHRKKTSLLTRNPTAYAGLFLVSAPVWWLFELINHWTQNWIYLGEEDFSPLQFVALSTMSFSTVMPAVFGTAELAGTFRSLKRIRPGLSITPTPTLLLLLFATGLCMLFLVILWPNLFYPFVWISIFFLIEPLNIRLGYRSLFGDLSHGDWRPILALGTGCLICGFFWEMWNYLSYPKWIYRIPCFDWFPLFEMPLLGYLGYLPFSLELFSLYHLITGPFVGNGNRNYLRLID